MLKNNTMAQLHTFMLVANYPSFSRAAKELHLTTGAISQQLLQLETQLGFSLFVRHARGVQLSEAGASLLAVVQRSFQEINQCVGHLRHTLSRQEVRLKLTPSLAFKWLVPRLDDFYRQYPEIQIQLFAEGALVDSDRHDFDLAIDYGALPYTKPNAELLMEESLIPVMSPSYWQAHKALLQKDDDVWQQLVLLHDAMPWAKASKDHEWQYWAHQMGISITALQGHFFNRTDMAMSAAEAGVGIAMARCALLSNELATGRLIAPFEPIPAQAGYFLITHTQNDATHIVSSWLKQQVILLSPVSRSHLTL